MTFPDDVDLEHGSSSVWKLLDSDVCRQEVQRSLADNGRFEEERARGNHHPGQTVM